LAEFNIDSGVASDLTNTLVDFSVGSEVTEGADGSVELEYQNPHWSTDYGYYLKIPEFKVAVDTKALWTVGAGYEAEDSTVLLLDMIRGNGKDSFGSIIENMVKIKTISQDSFSEIIRDENDILVNLKPLDPSSIVIVQNKSGRIIRYEQRTKVNNSLDIKKFAPDEIFHLSHERIADSIHGTRLMESLEWLILARNEAMSDFKRVLHRNVDPLWVIHLDTDDATQISNFKTKYDNARKNGENMYVPKDVVVPELVSVSQNATLNPLQWIEKLNDYFFQAVMVPQIVIGQGKEFTDASGKIVYLAYEQSVKAEQLYVEEQILNQLNVEVKFNFPASLQNELISSNDKSPVSGAAEPNDTTVEMEGRT